MIPRDLDNSRIMTRVGMLYHLLITCCRNSFLSCKRAFLAWLFSEKTRSIAITLASLSLYHRLCAKILTFCNISVFTEDIYLKLGVCVHYPKSNPYYQGRKQFKMHFFRTMSLFRLTLFILYQAPTCGALVKKIVTKVMENFHVTCLSFDSVL